MAELVLAVVVVVVLGCVAASVRTVPAGHAGVVERRRGRPRVTGPGVVLLVPLAERLTHRVDLRETELRLTAEPLVDADHLVHTLDVTIHHDVRDPVAAVLAVADHSTALEELTRAVLRSVVGALPTEEVTGHEAWLGRRLHEELGESVRAWGLEVRRVEVARGAPGGR